MSIHIRMTTTLQAYEAILEYTRGHTGLDCNVSNCHLVKSSASNDIYFRVECTPERTSRSKHPLRLVLDEVQVIVSGVIQRRRGDHEPVGREDVPLQEFNALELHEINDLALVQCAFQFTTPQGGTGGLSRLFGLRNGLIHEIN